jgi:hypothetical protein
MQRARRVALVAALAVLGAAALAGCRSQPNVAAYVGDLKITEAKVNQVIDEVLPRMNKSQLGAVRQDVVRWLVVGEVARRVAAERGYPVEDADRDQLAAQAQLPTGTRLARVYGDWLINVNAVYAKAQPVEATSEDLHAIYDQQVADGSLPPGTSFEEATANVDQARLARVVGLRNALRDAAKRMHVTVNPRYRPLVLTLAGVPLPLGAD